jgi:hypothetical protein
MTTLVDVLAIQERETWSEAVGGNISEIWREV